MLVSSLDSSWITVLLYALNTTKIAGLLAPPFFGIPFHCCLFTSVQGSFTLLTLFCPVPAHFFTVPTFSMECITASYGREMDFLLIPWLLVLLQVSCWISDMSLHSLLKSRLPDFKHWLSTMQMMHQDFSFVSMHRLWLFFATSYSSITPTTLLKNLLHLSTWVDPTPLQVWLLHLHKKAGWPSWPSCWTPMLIHWDCCHSWSCPRAPNHGFSFDPVQWLCTVSYWTCKCQSDPGSLHLWCLILKTVNELDSFSSYEIQCFTNGNKLCICFDLADV